MPSRGRSASLVAVAALAVACGCASAETGGARGGGNGTGATGGKSAATAGTSAGNLAGTGAPVGDAGARTTPTTGGGAGSAATIPCNTVGDTRPCCNGGTQTCAGNEFPAWGPCLDGTGETLVCETCLAELGNCDGGVDAGSPDAGHDAGTPPGGGCGPGMVCKPGSIRYCDVAGTEWSKATCNAAGQWDPCVPIDVPPEVVGIGDCSASDYSPEMCCPQVFFCCQDNPGGPFKDFGSGACAAVDCP